MEGGWGYIAMKEIGKSHLPLNMLLAIAPQGMMGVSLWDTWNGSQFVVSCMQDDASIRSVFFWQTQTIEREATGKVH